MVLSCDFETTNDINDCRVWCWGACEVSLNPGFEWGIDIESFWEYILTLKELKKVYFHNLKFDAQFLISYLLRTGYHIVTSRLKMPVKSVYTLVSDKGQFYMLKVQVTKKQSITFLDSLKLLPFKVKELPKAFGFEKSQQKGEIDYNKHRPIGYMPTKEELKYQKDDVQIVAKSLYHIFNEGQTKMTVGANAMQSYKQIIGERNFKNWFPVLECDEYIRRSYRGGFSWVNPKFQNKGVKVGRVYDVNSLYPSVLHDCLLPLGEPIYFKGKYEYDPHYPLYVCNVIIDIKLKPEHIPCLQIKKCFRYGSNEYITETRQPEEITVTSVDLEMIYSQYEVREIIFLDGFKFRGSKTMFCAFVDFYMKQKIDAELSGNKALRTLAKLTQNNVYGKFGTNPNVQGKYPELNEEGIIKWHLTEKDTREPVYIPVATFVTAYARQKTIMTAQSVYDRFCYADTDSIHIVGVDEPNIDVDPVKLGAWKHESTFRRAKFIRQKTYIEEIWNPGDKDNPPRWKLNITCAGMPEACYKHVKWTNFKPGASFKGHLQTVSAPGGVCLLPNEFTIKK